MRTGRANRLARRADRLREDGTRGRRARHAWETLTAAADRFDATAAAALRETWLRNPREVTWPDVARWCSPADVLAAAVAPHRSAAARAAIGVFCRRHDLLPDNDIDTVLFFVLTGQHERYEAVDPHGTLLAGGYRGASDATKTALRQTMLGLGAVSLVRVIADRPDRALTMAEGDYLATQLANARDWDQLWRIVPTIPFAGAVRAAKLFGDWRPADGAGRRLLTLLAAADPQVVGAVADAAVTRFKGRYPLGFSFAPDGSELAIRESKGTTIVDPRTGDRLVDHPDREQLDVLALGDGVIVHKGGQGNDFSVIRGTPRRPHEVIAVDKPGSAIGAVPGGFVVSYDGHLVYHSANRLLRREFVGEPQLGQGGMAFGMTASDPTTGRIVMRAGGVGREAELVLLDADLTRLARLEGERYYRNAFCGPDRLVQWRWGEHRAMGSWRRDGQTFVRTAKIDLDDGFMEPAILPARNLVVMRRSGKGLVWLDADTLAEVARPPGFPSLDTRHVVFSPDGALVAVAPGGPGDTFKSGAAVYDLAACELATLFERSLARMVPADLATAEAQAKRDLAPPAAAAVELLRAGLAHRFGADIALGAGDRVVAGTDDIALGGAG
jgi:hypothetical protein